MNDRFESSTPGFARLFAPDVVIGLAWGTGLLLLLAYLVDRGQAQFVIAVLYLAVAVVGLVLMRFQPKAAARQITYIGMGLAASFGLLALPGTGDWTWWVALAGLSALPAVAAKTSLQMRVIAAYAVLTVVAAGVGSLLAGSLQGQGDTVVLALGTILVGQSTALVRFTIRVTKAQKSPQDPRRVTMTAPVLPPEDLAELSTRIHVTSDGLVRAAQAINDVIEQQSEGSNEQVETIESTNELMEDFLKLSEKINEQARLMTEATQQTAEMSESGQAAIREAIQGMEQIRQQVSAIGTTIVTLAQLTRRIDEIITSVSEIATQSNLLALNASIEAARAGSQGRGFAVVADEVRSLSQQSTGAAEQVRAILAEIQSAVKQTVSATEVGMEGVDAGVEKTQQADQIMMQLAENMAASNKAVSAIYDVIRQQVEGLEEISISMSRIDAITQQNLAGMRMVKTVSTNLTRLADELQDAVSLGQQGTLAAEHADDKDTERR